MTKEEWLTAVEAASGMSRQQFAGLGLRIIELTCRRIECKGWHFVPDNNDAELQIILDAKDE